MRGRMHFLIPSSSSLCEQHMDQTCLCSTIWWPLLWFREASRRRTSREKNQHPLIFSFCLQYRLPPLDGVSNLSPFWLLQSGELSNMQTESHHVSSDTFLFHHHLHGCTLTPPPPTITTSPLAISMVQCAAPVISPPHSSDERRFALPGD